jgi:hypothetical protein
MTASWPPNADELRKDRMQLLLRCLQDPAYAAVVKRRCADDPVYFIENFGWVEARQAIGATATAIPVLMYPQQKEYVLHMVDILKQAAASETFNWNELVEKARMTAGTWSTLFVFIWFWIFHNASFLIMSKKEDDVDKEGDLDTPFEKIRFFVRKLPNFLLPVGFDINSKKWSKTLLLKLPGGGQISGDSSAVHATRQKRALAILYDEFAYCENDEAIWTGGAGTVKVRIAVSTPNGVNNKYYRLRFNKENEKVHITSFTWWRHPVFGKDLRQLADGRYTSPWYEDKVANNSAQTVAKEYDLNYADSIGAKIFFSYNSQHVDDELAPNPESKLVRIWDPGLTFAVLFAEIDRYERLLFYRELVMRNAVLDNVAAAVLDITEEIAPGCRVEDIGDPANIYRRGSITEDTEYSILQRKYGIYVRTTSISAVTTQKRTMQSITYLKDKMGTFMNDLKTTQFLINSKECPLLHEALSGAYAWEVDKNGHILEGKPAQIHPYEDVADCARYLALHANGGGVTGGNRRGLHVVKSQGKWDSPRAKKKAANDGWSRLDDGYKGPDKRNNQWPS